MLLKLARMNSTKDFLMHMVVNNNRSRKYNLLHGNSIERARKREEREREREKAGGGREEKKAA